MTFCLPNNVKIVYICIPLYLLGPYSLPVGVRDCAEVDTAAPSVSTEDIGITTVVEVATPK